MTLSITQRPSPNWRTRAGQAITLIVLHSDHDGTLQECIDWITNPNSHVSYHYSVGRTGALYQHVADEDAAFHAGVSAFLGKDDGRHGVNNFSLGINLSNKQDGIEQYATAQLDAAADLVAMLTTKYKIPLLWISTHAEVALPPGRKRDPAPDGPFHLMQFLDLVKARMGPV